MSKGAGERFWGTCGNSRVPSGCNVRHLQSGNKDPHHIKPEGPALEFGLQSGSKREVIEGKELRYLFIATKMSETGRKCLNPLQITSRYKGK